MLAPDIITIPVSDGQDVSRSGATFDRGQNNVTTSKAGFGHACHWIEHVRLAIDDVGRIPGKTEMAGGLTQSYRFTRLARTAAGPIDVVSLCCPNRLWLDGQRTIGQPSMLLNSKPARFLANPRKSSPLIVAQLPSGTLSCVIVFGSLEPESLPA